MKILQLIAAQGGWFARFKEDNGEIAEYPVAVWAIVEDDDGQRITSVSETHDPFFAPDDLAENFEGWRGPR